MSPDPPEIRFASGSMAGPYRIVERLGAGGMGEVYRAQDTRLNRTVAIKTLKGRFSERFELEARAISALNHPHICTLYDIGSQDGSGYLVMEYVEGEPLKGPLRIGEALRLGIQIAGALEAAHEKGILHRDLKPGNILVSKGGVKLLDFGLAKFVQLGPHQDNATVTAPLTGVGQIIGTLAYMSPEQIEGKPADARSDIFSFGLVLYEMLTGRRAFEAASNTGLMAAILKEEPRSPASLEPSIPPSLDRTVSKCLAKDPARRWQTAADLGDELEWIAKGESAAPRALPRRAFLPWVAGAAVAGAAGAGAAVWTWGRKIAPAPTAVIRLQLAPPAGAWPQRQIERQSPALSPAGNLVARIATGERGPMVWVQRLDSLTGHAVPGTEGATMVFWSPDGRSIGFWAGGKLKKAPAEGGTPLRICDLPGPGSATWNQNGVILASGRTSWLITVNSGAKTPWKQVSWPKFLPDGKHVLYMSRDPKTGGKWAYVEEYSSGRQTALMHTDTQVVFAADQPGSSRGYLVWGRNATLLAQRFDAETLRLSGEPVPIGKRFRSSRTAGRSSTHRRES